MTQSDLISKIQLEHFNFIDQSLSIEKSVYIIDDYSLPNQLQFPFKLTFTSAIVCTQGELNTIVNQQKLTAIKGDVIIIQYGSIIEDLTCSPDLKTISMAFAETDEGRIFNRPAEKLDKLLIHRHIPISLHLKEEQFLRYMNLYNQIKELYKDTSSTLQEEIIKGFISISVASFFSILQTSFNEKLESKTESRKEEVFLHFMDDLQLHANHERSVKFYSDRLCISPKHFSKLVRQASGKLPMEHIKQQVIIEAKMLLRTTDMTISEIADLLHFPTDSFFCQYFKREIGCTPSEYRKKI